MNRTPLPWTECRRAVRDLDPIRPVGRVSRLVGMTIEVTGLAAPVGAQVRIETGRQTTPVLAKVVGFREQTLLLMPYADSEGVAPGRAAVLTAAELTVPVGPALLGRVLDGLGRPIDGGPSLGGGPRRVTSGRAPAALTRRRCGQMLPTGVRAIDSLVTAARGQRMGIFAGSGVGKSVLLGMLARRAEVDMTVLALIGERGREVREFIERDLGPEGLARSVVVVVTSDESAVLRAQGAETAMAIAESFRDERRDVLFLMDSATRYAMALREIGLAAGEPPTTKGYTPSVFAALPRLCERAGWSTESSITAFLTVLIEGDDLQDPIGDALRSILDGHVVLSRDLARRNQYPAVDVLGSISRLRRDVLSEKELSAGARVLEWLKVLEDNRDLINIGAYASGSDPRVDEALAHEEAVRTFLSQGMEEEAPPDASLRGLCDLVTVGAA